MIQDEIYPYIVYMNKILLLTGLKDVSILLIGFDIMLLGIT